MGGKRSAIGYAARGYVIQMTNPKMALAWIAIISLGLEPGAPIWGGWECFVTFRGCG